MSRIRSKPWPAKFVSTFALALMVTPAAFAAPPEPAAKATDPATAAARLNLIDRQRMLADMMAKGLCFIDLRVEKKLHRNQMSVAQYVFHSTLESLKVGNPGLDLPAEQNPELIETLDQIKLDWVKYSEPLNSWTGGRWGKKQFALKVYEVDEDYTKQLTKAIEHYRKVMVEQGAVSESAAKTILAAGRQRTLTQQIAKEFCQALSGYKPEETPGRLKEAVATFKDVTDKFAKGDKDVGLEGEQPGIVVDTISETRGLLAGIEPVIEKAATGTVPPQEELDLVASSTLQLLRQWEKITSTYVLLSKD